MTQYNVRSMVIFCPVNVIPMVDAMAETLGYKAGFSVPLSPDGTGEPTYKGLHATARRHFLWLVTGQPDPLPTVSDEPTPLTEAELQAIADGEAALVFPDPESDTYDADLVAYHDALSTIRAPLHAYSRAVRTRKEEQKAYDEITADLTIYNGLMANLDETEVNALRAQLIVSGDPVVDDVALYGRAHVDWLASQHNLSVIEDADIQEKIL